MWALLETKEQTSSLDIELGCTFTFLLIGPQTYTLAHSGRNSGTMKSETNSMKYYQKLWNNETRDKLYEILPNLKESLCNTAQTIYSKQDSVMTRLRVSHTWITHSYLLKKEDQPFCRACHSPFTVEHVLIECPDFTHIRNKFYTTTDVHSLFREIDCSKITEYLKEVGLYDEI